MSTDFSYDVFLSHSSKDKPVVRELAERLKADGLRVWFDEWEIKPGDMILKSIELGLEASRVLILAMSTHAFESEWAALESGTFRFRDPTNKERRFIPIRLDDAEVNETLKQFAYIDWRERSEEDYTRLMMACRPASAYRAAVKQREQQSPPVIVVEGHTDGVQGVAVTPDGRLAVSGSTDKTVRVWDIEAGKCMAKLEGHAGYVSGVAMTPDGRLAVSSSADKTVRVWNIEAGKCKAKLEGHADYVLCVAVTSDGRVAVSGSADGTVRVWDIEAGKCKATLEGHTNAVFGVAVTPDGRLAVSGCIHGTVRVWDIEAGKCMAKLEGHSHAVLGVAVTPDGRLAVSGSADSTVRVWNIEAGKCTATFEGHTENVSGVAVTPDGRLAVSGSADNTVRVWDIAAGKSTAKLEGHTEKVSGVAVTPDGRLVVSGSEDRTVRVWSLPPTDATPARAADTARYTRLWDFAGQADYRLIHQLYMDETALAVLVFNPQSENPFEGLGQWDADLQRASRRPFRKILVGGRADRGALMVTRESIEEFRTDRGFDDYIETSALLGTGCDKLRQAIIDHIPWDDIPWTASPRIFRLLKEEIIRLKDEGKKLLRMAELRQQLEMRLPSESFTPEQLRAVVGLLAVPGVVWRLEFGDFVLLQPERINSYAAAVVRSIRAHTEEIGCIAEEDVLAGKLDYQDMERLSYEEEQIVLRAMHQTFVDHGLCLREHTEKGTLLIFPSYFKRERPELHGHPASFVTYQFTGAVEEIYATLVIRLQNTLAFERDQLWRFAADFRTQENKRLGFKMQKRAEGAAELAIYFDPAIPDDTKVTFIKYVHEHLLERAYDVVRLRHYVCPHCHKPVKDSEEAWHRLSSGKSSIVCVGCEKRVPLLDPIERKFASEEFQRKVRRLDEEAKAATDNESLELILVGHAFSIAGEAGQIFRPTPNSDWGVDGEIEFKDYEGQASGQRVYLQLKSGDSYLRQYRRDGSEVFTIKQPRHARYWTAHAYPVMLVVRTSDGNIRWMNVTDYLERHGPDRRQIAFDGEPFTALNLQRMRDRVLGIP
ncbi:MAG: TIR domain-containing protein [Armatimonadetes bacterium]|nr:TIR domain-containing protein [Armatimonadota bacterium]